MVKRPGSVARLGLFFRPRHKASCFRRNRFSAASAPRERSPVLNTVNRSNDTRREVHKNFASWGSFSMADKSYMLKSQFSCQIEYLRSTGRTEAARGTAEARNRGIAGKGCQVHGEAPQAAIADVADVPGEPDRKSVV